MDELSTQAMAAAVEVAARYGIRGVSPQLFKDGSNAMVHLHPSPVVARVATTGAWIRTPVEKWLQRDLDIATYLAGQGVPVVPPSAEIPPGPHISSEASGSMAMTFWTFVEQDREHPASSEEAAVSLRELHRVLKGYPGELPFLGVLLEELPQWLRWLERNRALPAADLIALRQAQWALARTLRASRSPLQPLHGDAHSGNLLRTPGGLLWLDFEDACTGPVAWDVATRLSSKSQHADRLLAAYADAPSWDELMPFLQARELEGVIYFQVLAKRFPHRAPEAEAALRAWHGKWGQ
jgi:Ser/Thr protein kinase RdoA (MazF antagonist)